MVCVEVMLGRTGDPSHSIIPHRVGKCKSAGGFCAELFPWGIFLFIYLRADVCGRGAGEYWKKLCGRAARRIKGVIARSSSRDLRRGNPFPHERTRNHFTGVGFCVFKASVRHCKNSVSQPTPVEFFRNLFKEYGLPRQDLTALPRNDTSRAVRSRDVWPRPIISRRMP